MLDPVNLEHRREKMKRILIILPMIVFLSMTCYADNFITRTQGTEASQKPVEQWTIFELELNGPREGNPFIDVELSAEFTKGDQTYSPQGFYDGDGIYKIRFMPDEVGQWQYVTTSNVKSLDGITGNFTCIQASENNHGPVRVRNTHYLAYEDGTPYYQIGTTCYAWIHQGEAMEERTLKTLADSPFNKLRMCIFPKDYVYNENEPVYYPFEGEPLKDWDFTRFNPEFWQHLEKRVVDLLELGIEADIILFHTYDRWGFEYMEDESDDRYIRYAVARLAAFRNVWWSLANEYDFMPDKDEEDWDRFFRIIQRQDPYQHLRGIHNGSRMYDHTKPWVTHASLQSSDMAAGTEFRKRYQKPVIYDECQYEGNIPQGWGDLTPQQMTERFWKGTLSGCYVGHGETYKHPEDLLWWAKGGVLRGESPERIAYLKSFMANAPVFEDLQPMGEGQGNFVLGIPGEYYLVYGRTAGNASVRLTGDSPYKIDAIDTWNMTETSYGTAQPGTYTFASPKQHMVYRFTPYEPGEQMRPQAEASADVLKGAAPLTVNFTSHHEYDVHWDFGDGATSQKLNPSHTFTEFGRYLVTLTVTNEEELSSTTALAITVLPPAPDDLDDYTTWPGPTAGLQFLWQQGEDPNMFEARGDAVITDTGVMEIGSGALLASEAVNQQLLNTCQKADQLTIEAIVTIARTDQSGPARIISYSEDSGQRNFTLGQDGENIIMRLRTPQTGSNGTDPQVTVCSITPKKPMHIVVSYYPGYMYGYLNGEVVYEGSAVQGDFSNWEPFHLIFGDEYSGERNWEGEISNVTIYNRFVGPEEAKQKYRLLK